MATRPPRWAGARHPALGEEVAVELSPSHLRAAARRWDDWSDGVAEAMAGLRRAPVESFGDASGEAMLLLDAVADAVSHLAGDADRLVDGLLLTARLVEDADERVADALTRPGAGW
jgi:hypothetical protein